MNVLIACEESQEVCKAFREKGHNAFSCDLHTCSGGHPEWHIIADVTKILETHNYDVYDYDPNTKSNKKIAEQTSIIFITEDGKINEVDNWDMIIAHPPCTYLSKVSAPILFNPDGTIKDWERLKKLFEARDFFLKIYNSNIPKIAVENPTPLKIANLPEANCVIQPFEHGEPYTKRTLLWLKGLPPIVPSNIYYGETKDYVSNHYGAKIRSKTFPGVAKAMADQWG